MDSPLSEFGQVLEFSLSHKMHFTKLMAALFICLVMIQTLIGLIHKTLQIQETLLENFATISACVQ